MQGTYDRIYSQFNSSSQAFQRAKKRVLKLRESRDIIKSLNLKYLYRNVNYPRKTSIMINKLLCPHCSEQLDLCILGLDASRRYRCKVLSEDIGANVRLYLPSPKDADARRDSLKKHIQQLVAREPGITFSKIAKQTRANRSIIRECIDELVRTGFLRCSEHFENGKMVKRYGLIMD